MSKIKARTILAFFLIVILLSNSELVAQTYIDMPATGPDTDYRVDLTKYCDRRGYSVWPDRSLDSVAKLRCSYYLSLMRNRPELSLRVLFDSIPLGKTAHQRFFGKPGFFTEPISANYTAPLLIMPHEELDICAEIMEQCIITIDTNIRLNKGSIISLTDRVLIGKFGSEYILDGYKNSPSHLAAIDKWGRYRYGSITMALIRMSTVHKKYRYEVLLFNSTLFARPYNKTQEVNEKKEKRRGRPNHISIR